MKIPEKIKIGGTEYSVEKVPGIPDRLMGDCNYAATTIRLAETIDSITTSSESMRSTFFHELTHAILAEMGSELNSNEEFVQTMSTFINQICIQLINYNNA